MESTGHQGQLVIMGGAEDKEGDCQILREFVRCAEELSSFQNSSLLHLTIQTH